MIRTTMEAFGGVGEQGMRIMPYLLPREVDGILGAIDSGDLVPVADLTNPGIGSATIAALARPDVAAKLERGSGDELERMLEELETARKELKALTEIIGEVFAEKEPADWRFKLDDAADDVRKALDEADFYAREL